MPLGWKAPLIILSVFAAVQVVPVARSGNPSSRSAISAPPQIKATLKRACYDCHSNQTRWPWYSRIAPASWLVHRDVTLGRKEVNFSQWEGYYPITRRRKLQWIGRVLREERMPPVSYELMHPEARLTRADRDALERWVRAALADDHAGRPHK